MVTSPAGDEAVVAMAVAPPLRFITTTAAVIATTMSAPAASATCSVVLERLPSNWARFCSRTVRDGAGAALLLRFRDLLDTPGPPAVDDMALSSAVQGGSVKE